MDDKEIWKTIKDYPDYEVSNYGRVKSLNYRCTKKEKVLKGTLNTTGYLTVSLCKNKSHKTFKIHQLVAISFLNHEPDGYKIVVDHKDNDPLNNNLDNLQLIAHRENVSKDRKGTSKFTGVCWNKNRNKWRAQIQINGKDKHLGYFTKELDAHNAYQKEL